MTWLFVTVGIGNQNYREAAERLCRQAKSFSVFDKLVLVEQNEINEIAPYLINWYNSDELKSTTGFGWYAWKAAVAKQAFAGRWGKFDNVMYLDAGCEMFVSYFAKKRLQGYMKLTEELGSCLFAISSQESHYSKRDVYDEFMEFDFPPEKQIQAGSWLLRSNIGLQIAEEWESYIRRGKHTVDISSSVKQEYSGFVQHRYDQSIFSLIAKKNKLNISNDRPPGKINGLKFYIRSFFYPFWWARSREGKSGIPRIMILLGRLTLITSYFSND